MQARTARCAGAHGVSTVARSRLGAREPGSRRPSGLGAFDGLGAARRRFWGLSRSARGSGELATGELTLTPSLVDPTGDYSTLTGAFDLNPHVMECLAAGETRLPRLPMLPSMGLMQSVEQALVYCNGASKLWRSIPGALEW